jgi:hypothetical protein
MELEELVDYYYYEMDTWESPFAVNYSWKSRNWFVSHGIKLHYISLDDIKRLGKTMIFEKDSYEMDYESNF